MKEEGGAPGPEGICVTVSQCCLALATGGISECACQVLHGSLIATAADCKGCLLREVDQAP